jgi:Na+-driven multidrug efflux pump
MQLALPAGLMLFFEWGAYEIILIMAGYIDVNSAGACSIVLILFYVLMSMLCGGQTGATISVANSIGGDDP